MATRDERPANEVATARRTDAIAPVEFPRLLVLCGDTVRAVPIPDSGEIRIGRSPDADVVVDDDLLSRIHVVVEVGAGGALRVRDEKSSNGTIVRGERLAPGRSVAFAPGELVEAGRTRILLMPAGGLARRRRIWPHGYFELRVEEACERSAGPFSLLRVEPGAPRAAFEEAISSLLGPEDVIAEWSRDDYEIMLAGTGPSDADRWLEKLGSRLGAPVRAARVSFPQDGRDPDALLERCGKALRAEAPPRSGERQTIIADERMREVHAFLERIAPGDISTLFLGETGVGKEILVERLHHLSKRKDGPLLRLNCGGLTESLLESELFGHEKGAFTGADKAKQGLFETAEKGTVFLDEVGEMPLSIQAKLLRVLEERKVRRVGGLETRTVDVRFVAATHRDLERMVEAATFRSDLFYRLAGVTVLIPPLRERSVEIAPLARAFASEVARRNGAASGPAIAPDAISMLERYGWPGNIRELRNVIERAWLLSAGGTIAVEHLPVEKLASRLLAPAGSPSLPRADAAPASPREAAERGLHEARKRELVEALESCAGNQTRAAKSLGISRKTLMARLDEFGLARPKKGRDGE